MIPAEHPLMVAMAKLSHCGEVRIYISGKSNIKKREQQPQPEPVACRFPAGKGRDVRASGSPLASKKTLRLPGRARQLSLSTAINGSAKPSTNLPFPFSSALFNEKKYRGFPLYKYIV